jgi:hypothetical protein
LIELSADNTIQLEFPPEELDNFLLVQENEYSELVIEALKKLNPFAMSYVCEIRFSSMAVMKAKQRNHLSLGNDLYLCVSTIKPRIEELINEKHPQISH